MQKLTDFADTFAVKRLQSQSNSDLINGSQLARGLTVTVRPARYHNEGCVFVHVADDDNNNKNKTAGSGSPSV